VGARRYILRRLLQAVPVLFFVSVIVFLVVHLSPGDPAVQMYGAQPGVTKDMLALLVRVCADGFQVRRTAREVQVDEPPSDQETDRRSC
jgi:ABC-type dipeptide/oligopeptide/nickel transport system permease component